MTCINLGLLLKSCVPTSAGPSVGFPPRCFGSLTHNPAVFLVTEPIVLLLAIYVSILYGTLYALFSGFPIVFQDHRHFSPGEGGLAFIGVGIGISCGTASQSIQNRIYWKSMEKSPTGRAPPEA